MQRKLSAILPATACAVLITVASAQAEVSALPSTIFDQPVATTVHASTTTSAMSPVLVWANGAEFGVTTGYNGSSACTSGLVTYGTAPLAATGDPYFFGSLRVCVRQTTSAAPGRTTSVAVAIGGSRAIFRATTAGDLHPDDDADGDAIPNGGEAAGGRDPRVKDNDVFSPGLASATLFAMQQYRDFLGREGDAPGIGGWAALVDSGGKTRPQVIDDFVNSPEFGGFVAPVVRLYFATFLRVPDYEGLTGNAALVRGGSVTLLQLADFFTASPEFAATYGALDNTAFVTLLYNNVLGRAPDPAGLSGWVALLDGGMSRGQVLLGFSDSAEYQAAMANEVLVTMMYTAMLRRSPDPSGFSGWVQFLDAATYTREQVINGFLLSTEYRARFLP